VDAAGPSNLTPSAPGGPGPAPRRTDRIVARVVQTKGRLDASRVGHVQRRLVQADLANQALILAALALSLLLPLLVTLAAILPLGGADSLPATVGGRLSLSSTAIEDLQRLFPTRAAVRGGSTVVGGIFTVASAYAWPTALQRGYEIAWGVESRGWRGLWRPFVWLTGFVAVGAVLLVLPESGLAQPWRTVLLLLIWTPIVFAGTWWTQHFLLFGEVGWRMLLPGAVAISVGLLALRAFAAVYLSTAIRDNYDQYGPLGIVFMLLTWLIALSVVMLGGAVLGAALYEHRHATTTPPGEPSDARDAAPARSVPAPRSQDVAAPLLADTSDGTE
jgi:membrane protein